jgi:NAD(P)-dependent dehydrogenase (short-subunit alcohol dehydrogenase family)
MFTNTFTGKVALVTGATSGIGRATAVAFAKAGAKVSIAGRREQEGAEVVREIEQAGGEALFVRTDVAKEADVQALVSRTVERFGRLDFAFNNAGIFLDAGPVTESTEDVYERTMNVNVRGVFHGLKHQIPAILASGGGAIVNNASALGLSVIPNAAIYNASKFAVIGLTKTAAIEFSAKGVRVNAVCPAVVETDINAGMRSDAQGHAALLALHPIGRFGKVDEIASVVLFLCSPGAAFTTGIAMPVDGGWTAQ